ncbi:uncharacterized protein LOC119374956 [Rhipicephalus sanguineus]|uniref:Uncharacterized protein n=1 Tax=Rhipicephalus sanguineus TaxID=34632 RepID=A0A9D4QDL2_RHISA|nr:uncharacterized protein LOC119374956 [Rhipicephalus sanguineus]KAH7972778.1 hypothetical protein HPB52_016900 [Rhipicephalus sanguineus]
MEPSAGLVVATWDALLGLLVCTPLVVAHWRAVWFLLDWFVLPERPLVSSWLCCVIGHALVLAAHLAQHALGSIGDDEVAVADAKVQLQQQRRRPLQRPWREFAGRIYTPLLSVATIAQWRGVWLLHDLYLVDAGPLPSALVSLVFGCLGLALTGALKTMSASPPFAVGSDAPWAYFDAPTRLGRRPDLEGGWPWFTVDCMLTVVVMHTLLISGWRGLWALLDVLRRSPMASLVSGTTATVLLMVTQAPAGILWRRLGGETKAPKNILDGEAGVPKAMLDEESKPSKNAPRGLSWVQRLFEELWHLAAAYACVSVWRGIWMLVDEWLQDDMPAFALLAIGSFLLLQCLYAANNVLTRGVSVDGRGVAFDVAFLAELLTAPSSGLS